MNGKVVAVVTFMAFTFDRTLGFPMTIAAYFARVRATFNLLGSARKLLGQFFTIGASA